MYKKKKGRDLTQSYEKSPYIHRKTQEEKWQQKTHPKTSISQRMWTDLGRSVAVTKAIQLVLLYWYTWSQPSQKTAKAV